MSKKKWQKPGVVFQPRVAKGMQSGINQIVDLIAPTFGPYPRVVALESTRGRETLPETLDDGATIVRRIIQIADREEDVGAMYLRHVLWRMHEQVGDGTAMTAIMFQAVYNEGLKCIAAGSNAMRLRHWLEEGLRLILDELSDMTFHLEGKEALGNLAETICHDPPLAKMLGEIFDIIGAYGRLEVRKGKTRHLEREYIEGMYWQGGVLSRVLYENKPKLRVELNEPAILITDLTIEDPRELAFAIMMAIKEGHKALLISAQKLSDPCIGLLLRSEIQDKIDVTAVKTPGISSTQQRAAMQDLAVLTGGQPLMKAMGNKMTSLRPEHFGRARHAWADRFNLGIIGGSGDARQLRAHVAKLQRAFENAEEVGDRRLLQERIGKLMSGTALLRVGAFTEMALEKRKELAKQTAEAMRGAMREGVLPGGGAALWACRSKIQERLAGCTEPEECAAYRIILRTLEAPIRTMAKNAGLDPNAVIGKIEQAGPGYGYDLRQNEVVDMIEAGILDAAVVLKAAVRSAISSAALGLTTDAIIHIADPEERLDT